MCVCVCVTNRREYMVCIRPAENPNQHNMNEGKKLFKLEDTYLKLFICYLLSNGHNNKFRHRIARELTETVWHGWMKSGCGWGTMMPSLLAVLLLFVDFVVVIVAGRPDLLIKIVRYSQGLKIYSEHYE